MEHLKDTEKFTVYKKKLRTLEDAKDNNAEEIEENLSIYISKLVSWIERMVFNRTSKRVNFLLTRVNDNILEIVIDGNDDKDQNGNWRLKSDSSGDFLIENRISDTWTEEGKINIAGDYLPRRFVVFKKASGNGIKIDQVTPTFGFADLLGDQFSRNTGSTKPLLSAYNGDVDAWKFQADDEAFLSYHIPHDYVLGTDIFLHVHWSLNVVATGGTLTFKYTAIYAKGHNQTSGSTFTSTPKTDTFSSIDINDSGSGLFQYQQHLTEVIISGASATAALFDRDDFEPDGVIELTLELDADNLTGTPSDPFIHYVDIHYQTNSIVGTKNRTPDFYA